MRPARLPPLSPTPVSRDVLPFLSPSSLRPYHPERTHSRLISEAKFLTLGSLVIVRGASCLRECWSYTSEETRLPERLCGSELCPLSGPVTSTPS
ncbi:uncharacterized protein LOC104860574 [Fukomys damarensis]|uniref:uncharacterized protein LOC104860574 n=1 Tax=Fukomys damarensis TaxID=885580 RepID=UPI0014557504|nr:uncharacterized protein LOC104860574 [Fukomys damarensis]